MLARFVHVGCANVIAIWHAHCRQLVMDRNPALTEAEQWRYSAMSPIVDPRNRAEYLGEMVKSLVDAYRWVLWCPCDRAVKLAEIAARTMDIYQMGDAQKACEEATRHSQDLHRFLKYLDDAVIGVYQKLAAQVPIPPRLTGVTLDIQ